MPKPQDDLDVAVALSLIELESFFDWRLHCSKAADLMIRSNDKAYIAEVQKAVQALPAPESLKDITPYDYCLSTAATLARVRRRVLFEQKVQS